MVYLPNCGVSCCSLLCDLRAALLVAFGDEESSEMRDNIKNLSSIDMLTFFCESQPPKSLIFVLDQFNAVQEDSTDPNFYAISDQFSARKVLKQVHTQNMIF